MFIVLIATEWGTGQGGVNAFNRSLAAGLARVGGPYISVLCAVTCWSEKADAAARAHGVQLVPIEGDSEGRPLPNIGEGVVTWMREHRLGERVSLWVGHDLISGEAAIQAARMASGRAALIHHMDYKDYQNIVGGAGEKTAENHKRQIRLFRSEGAIIFGVGSELAGSAKRLSSGRAPVCTLVPGFPEPSPTNNAGSDTLRVIAVGRFDKTSEPVKQSRLVAAALGRAVQRSNRNIPALVAPTLTVLGVDPERARVGELEQIAREEAGRHVNVVPSGFERDGEVVAAQFAASNLAIMPSYREGFGLAGWEAIGSGVPLILGRETGLHAFISKLLGGRGRGCLRGVPLRGGDRDPEDVGAVADAIIGLAADLDGARRDAAELRKQLEAEADCTWSGTATAFLRFTHEQGVQIPLQVFAPAASTNTAMSDTGALSVRLNYPRCDRYPHCAELSLSIGQGSTRQQFDVIAELRFGITDFRHGRLDIQVYLKRAIVEVTSGRGRLHGRRLGDPPNPLPGVEPRAGGRWLVSDPDGREVMQHKALGDEILCQVQMPENTPAEVQVEVTAARRDFGCVFSSSTNKQSISATTTKIMKAFLQASLVRQPSGHVVLCTANMLEAIDDPQ